MYTRNDLLTHVGVICMVVAALVSGAYEFGSAHPELVYWTGDGLLAAGIISIVLGGILPNRAITGSDCGREGEVVWVWVRAEGSFSTVCYLVLLHPRTDMARFKTTEKPKLLIIPEDELRGVGKLTKGTAVFVNSERQLKRHERREEPHAAVE